MKHIRLILAAAIAALFVFSCYGIKDEDYPTLEQITIIAQSDTINAQLGEVLHYEGLQVISNTPVTYEWSYGPPMKNTTVEQHQFSTRWFIDTESPNIDWTFTKLGSYILRLKVDNGESIVYRFFRLNVNSGYDEGIAVLDNDAEGNSSIAFIKTLTSEEKAAGEQQLYHLAPVEGMKNGVSLFMSSANITSMSGEQSGLVIATADDEGSLHLLAPKTMELVMTDRMSKFGTAFSAFSGEYTGAHDFGVFLNGTDGKVYRFDLILGYLQDISNCPAGLDAALPALTRSMPTAASVIYPFFYNSSCLFTRTTASSGGKTFPAPDGYEIVFASCMRSVSSGSGTSGLYPIFVILRSKAAPDHYIVQRAYRQSGGTSQWLDDGEGNISVVTEFVSPDFKLNKDTKWVNTKFSNDVYFVADNAIYRWGLTTAPATMPAITLPAGEQIRDIATNFMGKAATSDSSSEVGEDLLYVATYNPSRPGENKGSVYVYRFSDDTLVTSYEGICHDPTSVIYKYRLN